MDMPKYFISLSIILYTLFGCSNNTEPEVLGSFPTILVENINSSDLYRHELRINSVKINENSLIADISYSGGCKDHEFALVISKYFNKTYPVQVEVFISHNNNGDSCEAFLTEEIAFSLLPLRDLYRNAYSDKGEIILMISNYGETHYLF
jgi:hypothetical protein